jgi:beta-lactam-binding protein with PASTA domain
VILKNVVKDTQSLATSTITGQQLTVSLATSYDKTNACVQTPKGAVGYQYPGGGNTVAPGSAVIIIVCSDNQDVIVANVVGQSKQDATLILKEQGLTAIPETTSACPAADEDNVISQNPTGDTVLKTVSLSVCEITPDTSGSS